MSAAPVLTRILRLTIDVVRGSGQGQQHVFNKSVISIGRDPENDLVFPEDVKVSRRHIELHVSNHQVFVKNLSQKNPIAADGEVITEKLLRPGSILRFGDTELRIGFEAASDTKSNLSLAPAAAGISFPPAPPTGPAPIAGDGRAGASMARVRPRVPAGGSKVGFYLIIGLVLVAGYFLMQTQVKKKNEVKLRDSVSTEMAITSSQSEYEKALKVIEQKGHDTIQYRLAQEQYLRGFRDYRQGQYLRAIEGFQAALSFYPAHDLARKYYALAKRRFDEQVQANMIKGKRYYGLSNYRLCMGYYSNVIKMKKDDRDPIRREALQYYRECEIKLRGKF